jgi:hypothetical protein
LLRSRFMIVNSFGQYLSRTVHDHEVGPADRRKHPILSGSTGSR